MKDFRRPGATLPQSPELALEIRRAHERRESALELADAIEETPDLFKLHASAEQPTSDVGARLRDALGVSLSTQFSWGDQSAALNAWKGACETLGVLVFETQRVAVDEARGFSIPAERFPVIVLNGSDAVLGRVFTLIHELAHLLLRNGGICEWSGGDGGLEGFCNRVAAATLMPAEAVKSMPEARSSELHKQNALRPLSRRFWVSEQAMLIRLVELRMVAQASAQSALKAMQARRALSDEEKGGPVPMFRRALKVNGRAFSSLVLAAYRADAITLSEVSGHLGLRLKHLPQLEVTLGQVG